MKKLLTTIILLLHVALSMAQWYITPSLGVGAAMIDDSDIGTLAVEIDYRVSTQFCMGVIAEYQYEASSPTSDEQKYTDIAYVLKTDILGLMNKHGLYDFFIDTGFGWGHHYTTARTDHNYHTYRVGIDYRLYNYERTLAGIVRLGTQFRTYAEHIGFLKQYGKVYFSVGVSYCF